jgi:AraC family transcriptional regulator, regulatory protein of adaptative response / methylated-DNA-[protein]-cysteine methyltransferase
MKLSIPTPDGTFIATYTPRGLAALDFPSTTTPVGRAYSRAASPRATPKSIRLWHTLTREALLATLSGKAIRELPPLDWTAATDFQKQVWTALLQIPIGETRSYGDIAQSIGKPNGSRAVGNACGANPIPVLVPCHRVLAKGSQIGGFSSGLHWKRLLLQREHRPQPFLQF